MFPRKTRNQNANDDSKYSKYDKNRRISAFSICLLAVPICCLLMIMYEFNILTVVNTNQKIATRQVYKLRGKVKNRRTRILIANYRDTKRCVETLVSLFDNAVKPELLYIGVYDQIYTSKNEDTCLEAYCAKVGQDNCRRSQISFQVVDAEDAKGPTVARYHTEELIKDEEFCMSIDSHLVFIQDWDREILSQWDSIKNENAIITVYPKSTEMIKAPNGQIQLMCYAKIESKETNAMIQYGAPTWIKPESTPRLQSQLAGGFNFGNCKQAKEIRNDPYTPYLFHGEEYSRAVRLWTHGYDFYAPNRDICYHWYEPRKVVWERDWSKRYPIQQKSRRRIRKMLGLSVSSNDVDTTDLEKFSLGNVRSFEQWKQFSGIDPTAPFTPSNDKQFNNCRKLELVPY